jgi:hypothetical protein
LNVCQAITERVWRLFWRVANAFDYLVTLVRFRILDALAGPEPETLVINNGSRIANE